MKKALPSGMGAIFSFMFNSEILRGRGPAGTSGSSSSSSSSSPTVNGTVFIGVKDYTWVWFTILNFTLKCGLNFNNIYCFHQLKPSFSFRVWVACTWERDTPIHVWCTSLWDMGRRHPPGHNIAKDIGESLTATLPTSGCFPAAPLISFSQKNRFSQKKMWISSHRHACPQDSIPNNHFSSKSCAYLSIFPFCNLGFKSICAACDFGGKQS